MNRQGIIGIAVVASLIWISWLFRYDIQTRTAPGPMVVMLDRWTGTVYVSYVDHLWIEIKNAHAKRAAAQDSAGAFEDLVPKKPQRLSDVQAAPDVPQWESAPAKPTKGPWEKYQPKP